MRNMLMSFVEIAMNLGARRLANGSILVLFLSSAAAQQGAPLPPDLVGKFNPAASWADSFRLPAATGTALGCQLSFDTAEKTVVLDWKIRIGDYSGVAWRVESVSFQPTAVCREAGTCDSFYVAGYVQRTGSTVIERWDVTNALTAMTVNPAGQTIVSLTHGLRKELLYSSNLMHPLKTMFVNPGDGGLFVLEGTDTGSLWRVDPVSGGESPVLHYSAYPFLKMFHRAAAYYSAANGFYVVLDRTPVWRILDPWAWGSVLLLDPQVTGPEVMFLRDPGVDGVMELVAASYSWDQFAAEGYFTALDWTYALH